MRLHLLQGFRDHESASFVIQMLIQPVPVPLSVPHSIEDPEFAELPAKALIVILLSRTLLRLLYLDIHSTWLLLIHSYSKLLM